MHSPREDRTFVLALSANFRGNAYGAKLEIRPANILYYFVIHAQRFKIFYLSDLHSILFQYKFPGNYNISCNLIGGRSPTPT